jgi:hypothetical protein
MNKGKKVGSSNQIFTGKLILKSLVDGIKNFDVVETDKSFNQTEKEGFISKEKDNISKLNKNNPLSKQLI